MMSMKFGVLTAGSDCPGLNAAIRAIGKSAFHNQCEVVGFLDGFEGLLNNKILPLSAASFSSILTTGGTILGTSRNKPHQVTFKDHILDMTETVVKTYQENKLDALICVGGAETIESALELSKKGLNLIVIPKSVDNSLAGTDTAIGFNTAVAVATEAVDRLHSTAHSHHRIIIVEIMGEKAGWLALGAGISGGADVILIPEIPYDIDKVAQAITLRSEAGKRFSIIAAAAGSLSKDYADFFEHYRQVNETLRSGVEKEMVASQIDQIESRMTGSTMLLANRLEHLTGLETRITILGHLLRGGAPTQEDRLLATRLGTEAVAHALRGDFGVMVGINGASIRTISLSQSAGMIKTIPQNHSWLISAREVNTCLGD